MNASTRTGPSPVTIPSPSDVAPAGMWLGVIRSLMALSGKSSQGRVLQARVPSGSAVSLLIPRPQGPGAQSDGAGHTSSALAFR